MRRLDAVDVVALATELGAAPGDIDLEALVGVLEQASVPSPAGRHGPHPADFAAALLHGLVAHDVLPARRGALAVVACRHALRVNGLDAEFEIEATRHLVRQVVNGELFDLEVAYWFDNRVWAVLPAEGGLAEVLSDDAAAVLARARTLAPPGEVTVDDIAGALARGDDAAVVRILERLGITGGGVEAAPKPSVSERTFGRDVERAVERAWRRALSQDVATIEPRHLLLGLSDADKAFNTRLIGGRGLVPSTGDNHISDGTLDELAEPYLAGAQDRDLVLLAAKHALEVASLHSRLAGVDAGFPRLARWWVGRTVAAAAAHG